jgi:branched-chain amino acid transport system substrate-binding protein
MTCKKAAMAVIIVLSVFFLTGLYSSVHAQQTIKIGAVQAIYGVFSDCFVNVNAGLQDALMIANDEGGINGKKIEYIMEPCHYKVPEQKEKLEKIIKEYKPLVVFGCSTGLGLALKEKITHEYKVLYSSTSFSGTLAQPGLYPSIFMAGPTYGEQVAILLKYIKRKTPNARIVFFCSDSAFGKDPIKYARSFARKLKIKIEAEIVVPFKQTNFTNEIALLKEKNPDYVIFQGFVLKPLPTVIKQCKAAGITSKFMGTFWTATKKVLDELGPAAEGYLVVNPYAYWGDVDVPMIKKIMDYTAQNYPEVKYRPNYYMQGFATGLVYVEVLRRADKAGKLNYDGLVEALRSLKNFDTDGLMAPISIVGNRFPAAQIVQANVTKGTFEPAPLPSGLAKWITIRYRY